MEFQEDKQIIRDDRLIISIETDNTRMGKLRAQETHWTQEEIRGGTKHGTGLDRV
jgi:hypothetical protein